MYFENSAPVLISLFLQSAVSSTGENTKCEMADLNLQTFDAVC